MITGHVPAVRLPPITRTASWPRLSQCEETWKIAEILLLRHQLAVLQRRQPRRPHLDWADRALHATLLAVIPKARHALRPRRSWRAISSPPTCWTAPRLK